MPSKKLSSAQAKEAKRQLAILKKKGLYKGDARKKPTRYALGQIKKYADVLSGKAAVVTAPSRKVAREYKEGFRVKGRKVVVTAEKNEKIRITKKGELYSYRNAYGRKIKKIFQRKRATSIQELPRSSSRRKLFYTIPFQRGSRVERYTFSEIEELARFMTGYDGKYKDWLKYVEIEEALDKPSDFEDGE